MQPLVYVAPMATDVVVCGVLVCTYTIYDMPSVLSVGCWYPAVAKEGAWQGGRRSSNTDIFTRKHSLCTAVIRHNMICMILRNIYIIHIRTRCIRSITYILPDYKVKRYHTLGTTPAGTRCCRSTSFLINTSYVITNCYI